MFLLLLSVQHLHPSLLQEHDHEARQGISPILPIKASPTWLSSVPKVLLRRVGRANQSLAEKGIALVISAVKGQ